MDRGAWWVTVHGVAKSRIQQSNLACMYTRTIRCSNSTPRYIPKRTEDRHSHKNLHTIVRSSIMCNNLKWNRTALMVQWIGVHLPCQGHRFDSWSRRIPHAMKLLSPRVTTTEPVLQNKGSHCNEKPMG